jgi:hypothetical protein
MVAFIIFLAEEHGNIFYKKVMIIMIDDVLMCNKCVANVQWITKYLDKTK